MNVWTKAMMVLLLLGAVSGCIPSQRELRNERDLEEMKRRLAEVERSATAQRQDRTAEVRERLDELARRQADLQAGLDGLRVDLQAVHGRLEDRAQEQDQLRQELALVRDDLGLKVKALEDRLGRVEEKASRAAVPPPPPETPEALYQRGLDLVQKEGDFAGGREALQQFLQRHPQNELAVNAMYWIGEAYYGEKKYENAILQFQDVIQKYGDHPKAAAALLKQGLAFQALGDSKNARIILKKVVDTFPLSEEAEKARKRLAEWGA